MTDAKNTSDISRRGALDAGLASIALTAGVAARAAPARIPIKFHDPIWNREAVARP